MVNKVEFSAKNLTSNAGLFLLFEYCKNNEIFDLISRDLVFDKDSTNKIKMNHIKTLMCGFFAGANKLERLKLLQSDPLIKEFDIQVREPETISRFAGEFSFKTTQMLRQINFKIFEKIIRKCKIKSIIIDIDSTVINVWGVQEGTAKGYPTLTKKLLAADCEWKCTEDKEVAEITTKPDNWERERRFVIA